MSVDELKKAVVRLSKKDRAKFFAWIGEISAEEWDRRVETDIKAGKFDKLAQKAIADHKAGLSRKL